MGRVVENDGVLVLALELHPCQGREGRPGHSVHGASKRIVLFAYTTI